MIAWKPNAACTRNQPLLDWIARLPELSLGPTAVYVVQVAASVFPGEGCKPALLSLPPLHGLHWPGIRTSQGEDQNIWFSLLRSEVTAIVHHKTNVAMQLYCGECFLRSRRSDESCRIETPLLTRPVNCDRPSRSTLENLVIAQPWHRLVYVQQHCSSELWVSTL